MKKWSSTVTDPFHVKFDLDTNIITYLVDKTYPSLTKLISLILSSDFVYQVTISNFVLYEFVGIRKREHFLRKVLHVNQPKNDSHDGSGFVNLSSLLKFKDTFTTPEMDYLDVRENIIQSIENDLLFLTDEIGVNIGSTSLHEDIFSSAKNLFLNSKISKEDSLVLISSIYPPTNENCDFLCVLTNDGGFCDAFKDPNFKSLTDQVFTNHNLVKPHVESIRDNGLNYSQLNLTQNHNDETIQGGFLRLLQQLIIDKNRGIYLGKTFNKKCSGISNVVCVNIATECSINIASHPILTIIGKNLDFIFSTPTVISDFKDKKTNQVSFPFTKDDLEDLKISFAFPELGEDYEIDKVEILAAMKEEGNLVFIHPDSFA